MWDFLSRLVAEILHINDLPKHISVENALIPIFCLLGKIGGYDIFQHWTYSSPQDMSFELYTVTVGPRTSLLRCSVFSIKMCYSSEKLGQNCGIFCRILTHTKAFLLSYYAKFHQNPVKIVTIGTTTDRRTRVIL